MDLMAMHPVHRKDMRCKIARLYIIHETPMKSSVYFNFPTASYLSFSSCALWFSLIT